MSLLSLSFFFFSFFLLFFFNLCNKLFACCSLSFCFCLKTRCVLFTVHHCPKQEGEDANSHDTHQREHDVGYQFATTSGAHG